MRTKTLLISILIATLILPGCFLKKSITFYVNDSTETTIPATIPLGIPFNLPIPTVSTSATQDFENNNTTPDLITSVSLDQLTITITNPPDQNFSFLKEIYIYIQYPDGSNEKLIASKTNISSSAKSIDLDVTNENLVPYLQQSGYKIRTKVKVSQALTHDVNIRIDLRFKVTAQLIK